MAEFAFTSVTVSVTEFAPRFAQLKLEFESTNVLTLQLSVELLFTCAAVMEPLPAPFKNTVTFWQFATGRRVSAMVITERQVDEFPLESLTVRITLFAPTFAQVKDVGGMEIVCIAQLSVELLFTWLAVTLAVPAPFN